MNGESGTLVHNPDVVATELPGETVLLDSSTGHVFTLNETGTIIWQTIERGMDVSVEAVCAEFGVDPAEAHQDCAELVDQLTESGLLLREG